jgi:hypothetical protein
MTEAQQKAYYQANARLTLLYALVDVCEALLMDLVEYQRKAGFQLKYEQKMYWRMFFRSCYNLRKVMKTASDDYKESYANVCDLFQTLFMTVIDRCDDVNGLDTFEEIINYAKSFPSIRGIEIK